MAKTLRLNNEEEKAMNEICLRVNRELVKAGKMPVKDTEMFHEIMKQTLLKGMIEVNREGKIKIEANHED